MERSSSLPARPESLEAIRNQIEAVSEAIRLDKKKSYRLKLAVDEIAANIINYGYPASGENGEKKEAQTIQVTVRAHSREISVTLEDHAVPFNPLEKDIPGEEELAKPPEERKIGGLGIMLARNNVDDFTYEFRDGKNINTLTIFFEDPD